MRVDSLHHRLGDLVTSGFVQGRTGLGGVNELAANDVDTGSEKKGHKGHTS